MTRMGMTKISPMAYYLGDLFFGVCTVRGILGESISYL